MEQIGIESFQGIGKQEVLQNLREIITTLENSPAVKAARMFQIMNDKRENDKVIGNDVTFTAATMNDIQNHPDVKLYYALRDILKINSD